MTLRTRLTDTLGRSPASPSLLVVTDSYVGSTLAADVDATGDVHLVTDRAGVAARTPDGVRTTVGDVTDGETLAAGAGAAVAVVALRRDRRALLVTQLLRTRFETGSLVVLLNDPQRRAAVADIATTVVCGTTCLSAALGAAVEQTLSESTSSHS